MGARATTTVPATSERASDRGAIAPRRIAGDATSLCAARKLVAETLCGVTPHVREVAVLLSGELVANAVIHGGGWFVLEVRASRHLVRVEVTDRTAGRPRVLHQDGNREYGRGMAIVDALSSAWGTEVRGSHKVVWFEVAA
jgi:serine/threonine-protein kinase RsbW